MTKVKEAKEDWLTAFSEWRNSPMVQGPSSSQLSFGRQVRSCILPQLLENPDVKEDARKRRHNEEENRFKRVTRYQSTPLHSDEKVWLQNRISKRWDIEGYVQGARPHGSSYVIETVNWGGSFLGTGSTSSQGKTQESRRSRRSSRSREQGCQVSRQARESRPKRKQWLEPQGRPASPIRS